MATPTSQEQLVLQLLNRARTDPSAEMQALFATGQSNINNAISFFGVNQATALSQVSGLGALAPLAWDLSLGTSADTHSNLMISFDQQSHNLPGEPGLLQRMIDAGFDFSQGGGAGENVYAYTEDPLHGHAGFYIDWGNGPGGIQDPAGHRNSMLSATFTKVGIGYIPVPGGQSIGPNALTQHFGYSAADAGPYIVGVAIDDNDGDDFYDIGEGLGGISVTAIGSGGTFSTTTWSSGGYSLSVAPGNYTVIFSGAGIGADQTVSVVVGSDNVAIDVESGGTPPTGATTGNDDLSGTAGPDVIDLLDGDDRYLGDFGNDSIDGGPGSDTLQGQSGDDTINGGDDGDRLIGGGGNDSITGGLGADTIFGDAGNDTLDGGDGVDRIFGSLDDDLLNGGASGDTLQGQAGNDTVNGDAGNDTAYGGPGDDIINGGADNDVIFGDDGMDTIDGGTGDDRMFAGAQDDEITGGLGNDTLGGGSGNDLLNGGIGNDKFYGDDGNDTLLGGEGDNVLTAGSGDDSLSTGSGIDRLNGDAGNDTLSSGAGNDQLNGGSDNDLLDSGDGRDRLIGGSGDDTILAGGDRDTLFGGSGDDSMNAGAGTDRIDGGAGSDTMTGGADADTFILNHHQAASNGDTDVLTDLDFAEDELIIRAFNGNGQVTIRSEADLFSLNLPGLTITDTGADTLLTFSEAGASHSVNLLGIDDPLTAG